MKIGIDLDGTLAYYAGYQGPNHIGDLYPGAKEWLHSLYTKGHQLWLFTARATDEDQHKIVKEWLVEQGIFECFEGITCVKHYFFDLFFDDRAVRFEGRYPSVESIEGTKPWWKAIH